jgi:hypothetical protein
MKDIASPDALIRAILAKQAVGWAKAFLPLVRMGAESQTRAALFGALCLYYARPFMNNSGLGQLSSKVIPESLYDTHKQLLLYRNKIAAHSDSTHEHEGVAVNGVFFRSNGHHLLVENRHLSPSPEFLDRIERLFDAVLTHLSDAVLRCLDDLPASETALPKGLYQLHCQRDMDWRFVPVSDDGLDGEHT